MSNVPNINRIRSIDRIPLIKQYPKPERKCEGNRNILYRVHFIYKSQQTGDKYYNLVGSNFVFNTDNPNRRIKAGDLVKYKPKGEKGKEDPNYGQVARITKITSPIKDEEAIRKNLPVKPDKKLTLVDIDFQNPKEVNNKVIMDKKNVSMNSLELLLQDNDVVSFVCSSSLIDKRVIRAYELARNNYKTERTTDNKRRLQESEDNLWNRYFEQDDNNQPMYPLLSEVDQINGIEELNKAVKRMVKLGFTADADDVRKKIIKRSKRKFAKFPVPEGFKPGKKITINIDGNDIVVKIPIQINGQTPKVREMIEVEIDMADNNEIFDKLKATSRLKKGKKLEFIPTVILSDYSNFDNGKKMVLGKLVKPSENQKFSIRSASIEKQGSHNFDFKKLDNFDKDIEKLVFDLEVKVILELDIKDQLPDGVEGTTMGNMGRSMKSAILSGNALNCRENMRKLKEGTQELIEKIMPAGVKQARDTRRENKKRDQENVDRIGREQKRILNNIQGRSRREGVRTSSNRQQNRGNRSNMAGRIRARQAASAAPSAPPLRSSRSPSGSAATSATPSAPPLRSASVGGKKRRRKKKISSKRLKKYKKKIKKKLTKNWRKKRKTKRKTLRRRRKIKRKNRTRKRY